MNERESRTWRSRAGHWWQRLGATLPMRTLMRVGQDDVFTLAASLSFYALLSLAPLILLLLWMSASLYPAAQEAFFTQLGLLGGSQIESTARLIVDNAERQPRLGSVAGIAGTAVLLIGASAVFAQLQTALNRIFRSEDAPAVRGIVPWLRKRVISFGIVLAVGFLLVVSMVLHTGISMLADRLPLQVPVLNIVFSFLVYGAVFAVMYRFLPDRDVATRDSLWGGALTALLFLAGREAIGLYLGRADMGTAYGPAGGVVVMILWMFYSAIVFFVGAIATSLLVERHGS